MRLNFHDAPKPLDPETIKTVNFWQSVHDRFFEIGFRGFHHTEVANIALQTGALIVATRHAGGITWKAIPK